MKNLILLLVLFFAAQTYASDCVAKKVSEGMSVEEAVNACYPKIPVNFPGFPAF